ncbi:hypothetical protein LZD49_20295 [Dyadobacter sp. CY261]|uniref:hypothetical protein n=1 Tax=Dyadobacter sp. CY261 TaxID=2907203 RepID=UPI001F3B15B3|nr:hypothetical protein [Dyadobacter sp. CY261]MCF0072832.1 hypothetical protein [Dyadobacter sp. CY261]
MRTILLVTGRNLKLTGIKRLLSDSYLDAAVNEVGCEDLTAYLQSGASPDLIIYAPRSVGRLGKKFLRVKALAGKAKFLVYSQFRHDEQKLFDYLAVGVNGILATNAQLTEQQRALDTVLRGDSFVDVMTRGNMLGRTIG